MKREDYENYKWYPLTDNEYWVEFGYQDEFPNCQTVVCKTGNPTNRIMTYNDAYVGWGTMAKSGTWKFMIIEKPKCNILE